MNNNHRLCLAEDGRTQYKIVIPEGASETLKYAAEELSKYLKEISGAVFPVTIEGQLTQEEEEGLILTGCGRLCREPVSYTHLDVYKRQFLYVLQAFPACRYGADG